MTARPTLPGLEPAAYRFRDDSYNAAWEYADADDLPPEDRELLRSKGWTVEALHLETPDPTDPRGPEDGGGV